jgi:hypothetical protein
LRNLNDTLSLMFFWCSGGNQECELLDLDWWIP